MIDFFQIDMIQFHDLPVKSLNIQSGDSPHDTQLIMEVFQYDEELDDYIEIRLVFGQCQQISHSSLSIEEKHDFEVTSFDWYLQDDLFFGKLILLTGIGNSSLDIDFSCVTVRVRELKN